MQEPQEAEVRLLHAQVCQALADPTRILILYQLADGPKSVGELAAALDTTQPTVSRHLKILRERGMATAERFGATVVYSLADHRVIEALDLMRSLLADNLAQKSALAETLRVAHSES